MNPQRTPEEELEMAWEAQRFSAVDSERWSCMKDEVRDQYGFTINTDNGTASQDGFTFTWSYNAGEQTLSVQCTDSPFWAPCSVINDRMQSIARNCGV
jgi:hypothetical protein